MTTKMTTIGDDRTTGIQPMQLIAAVSLGVLTLASVGVLWGSVKEGVQASPALVQAVGIALIAGAGTGLGGLAVLAMRKPAARGFGMLIAASAGIMLAAALLGLLMPALEESRRLAADSSLAWWPVAAGLAAGAAVLRLGRQLIEAADPAGRMRNAEGSWLVVSAIALHNVPEGLAVGASYVGGAEAGTTLALAIGLQNVPEGLVVAAALLAVGSTPQAAVLYAAATGLVEPVAALFGGVAAGLSPLMLPVSMAFAAGAMLWVIAAELLPASRRDYGGKRILIPLSGGFALMALLGQAL
jgi:ZIP family zinc transporter